MSTEEKCCHCGEVIDRFGPFSNMSIHICKSRGISESTTWVAPKFNPDRLTDNGKRILDLEDKVRILREALIESRQCAVWFLKGPYGYSPDLNTLELIDNALKQTEEKE